MTPEEQAVTRRISGTVEQLMKRSDTYDTIGAALGITGQSVGRKMRAEREWTAAEAERLALYFKCSVQTIYAGADALFAGVGSRKIGGDEGNMHFSLLAA